MTHQALSSRTVVSFILPIATAAFAIAIFSARVLYDPEIRFSVLYVAVVLMAARFCQARGVLLVSAGCACLTVLSVSLSPPAEPEPTPLINSSIIILALGLTTFLLLRGQSAEAALRERANLLDLTHDAVFTRGMNGPITYWNRAAEELYGWKRAEALGRLSHQLLEKTFPAPLDEINAELQERHRRCNGIGT